jgi:uncharacterized coiled-coil protein SlyX
MEKDLKVSELEAKLKIAESLIQQLKAVIVDQEAKIKELEVKKGK